jgi:diguanylate cyclase (GGDEF)-like protein/PAS domain S-box-containing protein
LTVSYRHTEQRKTSRPDETARLAALWALGVLDSAADPAIDEITELAAAICGTPMAAVSLVDSDRVWFKATTGMPARQIGRQSSFCTQVVADPNRPFVVTDARTDPRFAHNRMVTGEPHVRFYAGTPLVSTSGHVLGSLCVIDRDSRDLSEHQFWVLGTLARQVTRLIEHRAESRLLIETRSAVDAIISVDAYGRIISFHDGASTSFGYDGRSMIGRSVSMLIPSGSVGAHTAGMARLRRGGASALIGTTIDVAAIRRDGTQFAAELSVSTWERDGQRYFTAVLRDVSASRRSAELGALLERSTAIANDSNYLHEALPRVIRELQACGFASEVSGWVADLSDVAAERWISIDGDGAAGPPPEIAGHSGVHGVSLGAGESMVRVPVLLDDVLCAVLELRGPQSLAADIGLRTVLTDIAVQLGHLAQRARTVELTVRSLTDPLTGLANRRSILDVLQRRIDSPSGPSAGALLVLDLDRFKNVNDSLGHVIGDEVLRAAAERLSTLLRTHDVLARMGGDEFVVLCDSAAGNTEAATAVAQRLIEGLAEPFTVHSIQVYLGVSIGIALLQPGTSADASLRQADIAMYRAKNAGGNRSAIFDSAMDQHSRRNLDTDSALHRAVVNNELTAYFQPIVDPADRRPVGFEALIRWDRPGHGMVPPDKFIPLAEENGLIVAIGQYMVRSACEHLVQWTALQPSLADSYVSVNVAAAELQPGYHDRVLEILDDTGLPPERLVLEITESALLSDIDRTRELLEKLRSAGIRIALDDFGTGYSSLSYLRQLPVDIIKIDRSFISPMDTAPRARALLDVVFSLAEALDLSVVAEGVETTAQAAAMRERKCPAVQGYFYSRPVPADQVPGALAELRAVAVGELIGPTP